MAIQEKIDKEMRLTAKERFWSAVISCNITGGLIARSLGLHDYDMKAIYAWLKAMLEEMRHEVKPPQATPLTALGEFIDANINNILVVNGEIDLRSNLSPLPLAEPKGNALLIRYEPDTKHLYVSAKPFKDFCVRQQINYRTTLNDLTKLNVFVEAVNKRMSKGMKIVSPAVRVLKFDASNSEFLQIDTLVPQNEDRDGVLSD
jgi:hypothetical protein